MSDADKCRECGRTCSEITMGLCRNCLGVAMFMDRKRKKEAATALLEEKKNKKKKDLDHGTESDLDLDEPPAWVLSKGGSNGGPLSVHDDLANKLRPHQKEGVEFIFKNCFADFAEGDTSAVGGCVLAHFMGLGKSLATIALLHAVMNAPKSSATPVSTVLLLVPANTLPNWENEMLKWTENLDTPLRYFNLSKVVQSYRKAEMKKWKREGGILFMSEELFLRVAAFIIDEAQPQVLVLDEAHVMLKNAKTKSSKELRKLRTKRRIALTGTPLQNNVTEFFQLVDFVRPGAIEGIQTEKEFEEKFRTPIEAGLPGDADDDLRETSQLLQLELQEKLKPYIHRKGPKCLQDFLPPFHDTLLYLQPSCTQVSIMRQYEKTCETNNFFKRYQTIAPLLNHPGCLRDGRLSLDSDKLSKPKRKSKKPKGNPFEWLLDVLKPAEVQKLHETWRSPKFIILSHILAMASREGEKTLVYSKCLKTLDFVEQFLMQKNWKKEVTSLATHFPHNKLGGWKKNKEFVRIDGSINSGERGALVEEFNNSNHVMAFLISSEAGGIGINLTSATRVVIMDNHFNPTVSDQCVARAYRFGQDKPVHCYRLAIEGTLETKVYARAQNKSGVASGVIDGECVSRNFTSEELNNLNKIDCWVECAECGKKRLLPESEEPPAADEWWYCKLNVRDPKHNKCSSPEELKVSEAAKSSSTETDDEILEHLLDVINKKTRKTPLVTFCAQVHSSDEQTSQPKLLTNG